MREYHIRPARRVDLDEIAALERASFPSPWRREFFESELEADGRLNLVAIDTNRRLIAYLFAMYFLDELHVNKIAVEEKSRRKGVAVELMRNCMEFARSRDVRLISLEVRQSNEGAQAFYKRLGFRSAYTRPNYYPDGEAARVMTLEL